MLLGGSEVTGTMFLRVALDNAAWVLTIVVIGGSLALTDGAMAAAETS